MAKEKRSTQEQLPLWRLEFDPRYQRELNKAHMERIKAEFSWLRFGVIHVSLRADGSVYVIDGQHRVRAAMALDMSSDTKVPCLVHRGLLAEEEAELFAYYNRTSKPKPLQEFRAERFAGFEEATSIAEIVEEHGVHISTGSEDVQCISELRKLYRTDPDLLRQVIGVAIEAWGTKRGAFEATIVAALGRVLGRYDGQLDTAAFVKRLAGYKGGPAGLIGDARGLADLRPLTLRSAAATIMVDQYNLRRRSNVLPPL